MSSKCEAIINEYDIDVFESSDTTIISHIQILFGNGLDWITDSVADHTINILKYKPLSGRSYMKLQKEVEHSKKVLLIFKIL